MRECYPQQRPMWQSEALRGALDGIDVTGMRPVLRASPLLVLPAGNEAARVDRRHRQRRLPDSASSSGHLKELASAAACAALNSLDMAIVLLHSDRHVLLANPAAQRVAARGNCYQIKSTKLRLIDAHNQQVLETFLGNSKDVGQALGGPLSVVSRGNGAQDYFIFAEWLDLPSNRGAIASLLIHEPRLAGQLCPELLGQLYGLTKMESKLVAALYVAPVLQIAADRCEITLNTAKTHLKHAFAKCGVCSKAELLRLLALGPRTL